MFERSINSGSELRKEMLPPPEASIVETEMVSKLQRRIAGDQMLQKAIARDNEEIGTRKKHWAEYSDRNWGDRNRIALPEFLRTHGVVERNATLHKKVLSKKWTESLRWSNDAERQFLATAANIGQGKFVEVLQISLVCGGKVINKDATVGSGTEITKESLDIIIKNLDPALVAPDTVYIIHNHFDEYAEVTIPEDEEPKDGLVMTGRLSKSDIEFADKIWSETMGQKARVIMVAINERGLTFTYEAGTSEYRDWENDSE